MKPRSSKSINEAGRCHNDESLEDSLRLRIKELLGIVESSTKYSDGLRLKNVELAKSVEAHCSTNKDLNIRMLEHIKDNLILKSIISTLERKLKEIRTYFYEAQKSFADGTNYFINIHNILESSNNGDLTLSRIYPSTSTKSPMKAVHPMISGHTIQNPTISISKSDSQKINYLIQHGRGHDASLPLNESQNNNVTNNSLPDTSNNLNPHIISDRSNENNEVENVSNGDENESIEMENSNEVVEDARLSTIYELSLTHQDTTSISNIFSHTVLPEPDLSAISENSSNNSNISKRHQSVMPSPIDNNSMKALRRTSQRNKSSTKSGTFSNLSSIQNTVSSIGMTSRGSTAGLHSVSVPEDPLEGTSTYFDQSSLCVKEPRRSADGEIMTSTPMDIQRKIKILSITSFTANPNFVVTRKIKGSPKSYVNDSSIENSSNLNKSESLTDLNCVTDTTIRNTEPTSPVNTRNRRKKRSVSFPRSDDANSPNEIQSNSGDLDETAISPVSEESYSAPKKSRTKKANAKKAPKMAASAKQRAKKRKSRSHSPKSSSKIRNITEAVKESPKERIEADPIDRSDADSVQASPKKSQTKKSKVKKGPKIPAASKARNLKRKSRSHSPKSRSKNTDLNPETIADSVNPTVQLVRLVEPRKTTNKRRSRSFSPTNSEEGSEISHGSDVSTRSSRRTKIVNYNEPSLRIKMRRK